MLGVGHKFTYTSLAFIRGFHISSTKFVKDPVIAWFYATDIPKSKPSYIDYKQDKAATKYVAFSNKDSVRLEQAYQKSLNHVNEKSLIQVKEDGLFEVDLEGKELRPTYWNGPVYDVRRGMWFFSNSTSKQLVPCPEELSEKLEELYVELFERMESHEDAYNGKVLPFEYEDEFKSIVVDSVKFVPELENGIAWLYKADNSSLLDKLSSLGGDQKVVRGYRDDNDKKKKDSVKVANHNSSSSSPPPQTLQQSNELISRVVQLFSSESTNNDNKVSKQMEDDYNSPEMMDRPIDHLVLCIHGIGQKLNSRVESVNFVHDINTFRKVLKEVFCESTDLQVALNANSSLVNDKKHPLKTNNKVQVLPVIWRHDIEFGTPRSLLKDKNTVTLDDITVQTLTPLRNLIGDVVVDVLLYKDPVFKDQILNTVTYELNKIVRQFIAHNPDFSPKPKISLIGHSLGSVICYDLLTSRLSSRRPYSDRVPISKESLEFEVNNLFTMGSPLGLFQLIKQETIDYEKLNSRHFYNMFHPSDPISYRVEPLIHPQTYPITPATIPFSRSGLNSGLQDLGVVGQKISQATADIWNGVASYYLKGEWLDDVKNLKQFLADNNDNETKNKKMHNQKEEQDEAMKVKTENNKQTLENLPTAIQEEITKSLKNFNPTGRVDYSLQEGVLDISLVTAIGSHISYFENPDIAKFVLSHLYKD